MDAAIEREREQATIEREKMVKIEDAKGGCIICLLVSLSAILFYFFIHGQIFSDSSRNSVYSSTLGIFGNFVPIIGDLLLLAFIFAVLAAIIYFIKIIYLKQKLSKTFKIRIN